MAVGAEARLSRRRADGLCGRLHECAAHQRQPQRDAVGNARGRARGRGAQGRPGKRRARGLRGGLALLRDRRRSLEGAQCQAAVVAFRHAFGHRVRRLRHVDQHRGLLALRHARPRQARLGGAQAGGAMHAHRLPQARRSRHLRPSLLGVSLQHQSRGGPAGAPESRRSQAAKGVRARRLCGPVRPLLSGRRLRMGGGGLTPLRDQRAELRPLQNVRYQGPESEYYLGCARGRRRAELSEYVNGSLSINLAPVPRSPRRCGPIGASGVTMLPLSRLSKTVDMPDRGSYCGPGPNSPFCSTRPRRGRSSARWSRRAVISSPALRRAAVAALAALAITWPGMLSARAQAQSRDGLSRTSPSGSYLAARHAGGQRDAAAAASYYRAALRGDPRNNELLGRTFLAVLANGEVDEGVKLAERVLQVDKNDRIARLVLGVRALKQKQYPAARRELAQSIRGPITDLAATLLSAWTMANPTEAKQATDS